MTALTIPTWRGAHLPYPYDLATPADRQALQVVQETAWLIYCIRRDMGKGACSASAPVTGREVPKMRQGWRASPESSKRDATSG